MSRGVARCVMLAAVLLAACGCATYQVRTPSNDYAEIAYTQVTMHSFFWGLGEKPIETAEWKDGINDVEVVDNFLYDLIGVVTLGIWKPIDIRYRLRAPVEGAARPFPIPPPAEGDEDEHD